MAGLTIYGQPQSRAFRVLWMAHELGLDFRHVPTRFAGESKQPDYLAINPNGKVPAIDDDGFRISESMAINLYLAKKHGGPLAPASPREEAGATQWSFWGIVEIERPLLTAFFHRALFPEDRRKPDLADQAEKEIQRPLKVLNGCLEGRDWLIAERFCVADLNLASILAWAPRARISLEAYANVSSWLKRCTERPALQAATGG